MSTRLADLTPIALQVQNDGVALPREPGLNFTGAGVTASHDAANDRINVDIPGGGGGGGYATIQEEGASLAQETILNFIGAGVTAVAGTGKTNVTIPFSRDSTDELENKLINGGNNTIEELQWEDVMNIEGNGDLPIYDSGGGPNLLSIGSVGQVLTVVAGEALWADASGGITREQVANPFTDFYLYDEFFYPTPLTSLLVHYEILAGGTFVAPTNVIGGQIQFQTGGVANSVTRINTCGSGLLAIDSTKNIRYVVRLRKVANAANHATLISLYTDQGSKPGGVFPFASDQAPNIQFRGDGTANWFAETDNGGGGTNSIDTGVASDTAFHVFEIRSDPGVPNIEFLIDNSIVATVTTNLPSANMAMFIGVQTSNTGVESIVVDSMFLYSDR